MLTLSWGGGELIFKRASVNQKTCDSLIVFIYNALKSFPCKQDHKILDPKKKNTVNMISALKKTNNILLFTFRGIDKS